MEYNGVPLASMTTKQLSELAKSKGIGPKQSRAEFLNALADALLNEGEGEFGEGEPRVVSERRVETVETKMERRRDGEERVVTTSRRIITNEFGEEEEMEVDDVGVDASERGDPCPRRRRGMNRRFVREVAMGADEGAGTVGDGGRRTCWRS